MVQGRPTGAKKLPPPSLRRGLACLHPGLASPHTVSPAPTRSRRRRVCVSLPGFSALPKKHNWSATKTNLYCHISVMLCRLCGVCTFSHQRLRGPCPAILNFCSGTKGYSALYQSTLCAHFAPSVEQMYVKVGSAHFSQSAFKVCKMLQRTQRRGRPPWHKVHTLSVLRPH